MKPCKMIQVVPNLPERLTRLTELAHNLWWCWNREAVNLFARMSFELWHQTSHNPVALLGCSSQDRLQQLGNDAAFIAHYDRVLQEFDVYVKPANTWFSSHHEQSAAGVRIAYFSMEFGLTESLPVYSGGLGMLAGDHLKSASDLGLPLTGVGLLYQDGYFRQYLNDDGWQQEYYSSLDFYNLPIQLVRDAEQQPVFIMVPDGNEKYRAQIWKVMVGRVQLLLLDSNVPQNTELQRQITGKLYGGDGEMRIRQEILLGIGGMAALRAVGCEPSVCHMNEGHSAFLALDRIARLMREQQLDFDAAVRAARSGIIFTTHTPVPAGIDRFDPDVVEKHLAPYCREYQIPWGKVRALALDSAAREGDASFNMAVFALRLSTKRNGVSELHGKVSREMFATNWPSAQVEEVPIGHVTNGVHLRTWVADSIANLYSSYLGPGWITHTCNAKIWGAIRRIPAEELWRTHERRRERLVGFARRRVQEQLRKYGAPPSEIDAAAELLRPAALTIGFARRFASYKRAGLLFRDLSRIRRLLGNEQRPLQIIIAGKAHPRDNLGKEIIKGIMHLQRGPVFHSRVVFLQDYDMSIARELIAGVDVWLNTPRLPMEASGTSGMKAAANGVLNLSVPDGWWAEAYTPEVGWAIGKGERYDDADYQDLVEANALYDLLEKEVVPLFYDRSADGLPRGWIEKMKNSLAALPCFFNTDRMVENYCNDYYIPAARKHELLTRDGHRGSHDLWSWEKKLRKNWAGLEFMETSVCDQPEYHVGQELHARAALRLGELQPEDIMVELHYGRLTPDGDLGGANRVTMELERVADGVGHYRVGFTFRESGRGGIGFRVLPAHELLDNPFELGLSLWHE